MKKCQQCEKMRAEIVEMIKKDRKMSDFNNRMKKYMDHIFSHNEHDESRRS